MDYLILLLLVIMSAFFSASETAFSCCNRIRLKGYANDGNKRAGKALTIAEKFDKTLATILIGNNIVNIAAASLGTIVFTRLLNDGALGAVVSTIVMTIIVLIFGELLPKTVAKKNAEKIAMAFSGALSVLIVILVPISAVFMGINKLFDKLLPSNSEEPSVTEEELMAMIDEIEDEGVLEEAESDLVKSALEFDEITVSDILIPRVDVVAVEIGDSIEQIRDLFISEGYSRLPVYDKSIDNIVGVINEKDFFKLYVKNGKTIKSIIRQTVYVHSLQKISEAFTVMQKSKNHLAVVTDEYGGTEGIITLEDILEELVGEIWDESDEIQFPLIKVRDNVYDVSGELSTHDMLEMLELPTDMIESTYSTVGGWVMELLDRIPNQGDKVADGIFSVTVLKTFEQRIIKIRLEISNEENEE